MGKRKIMQLVPYSNPENNPLSRSNDSNHLEGWTDNVLVDHTIFFANIPRLAPIVASAIFECWPNNVFNHRIYSGNIPEFVPIASSTISFIESDPLTIKLLNSVTVFTQKELFDVNVEEKQVQQLISQISLFDKLSCKEIIKNKLDKLYIISKEEDPGSTGISLDSLRTFYKFLQNNIMIECPMISLTPDNDIYATWKNIDGQLLSLNFLQDGNVSFVLFKFDTNNPTKITPASDTIPVSQLFRVIDFTEILSWTLI
jgi:hypothetical protein